MVPLGGWTIAPPSADFSSVCIGRSEQALRGRERGLGRRGLCVQGTHFVGGIRQVAQEDPCAGDGPGH